MQRTDPIARRLLDNVLALERRPWPETRSAYADALLALGTQCERTEARAELHRWAMTTLGELLQHPNETMRECRVDAMADMVATLPGILFRFRSGLTDHRRPNATSMLRAWLIWRSGDIFESTHARHRRRWSSPDGRHRVASDNPEMSTLAREVIDRLDRDKPTHQALMLVGLGESVAEAARRMGVSRQSTYRAWDDLRAAVDGRSGE